MTYEELKEWIKGKTRIHTEGEYMDEAGNYEGFDVFEHEDKLYQIHFCNKRYSPRWGEHGYTEDYTPIEVIKKEKQVTITETTFEEIK